MGVEAAIDPEAAFWTFARQTAFYTANRYVSYESLKASWQRLHPEATHEEHEAMTLKLAGILRI